MNFTYDIENSKPYLAVLETTKRMPEESIVECLYSSKQNDENGKFIYFHAVQERFDKSEPNAYLTAISVLDAADLER